MLYILRPIINCQNYIFFINIGVQHSTLNSHGQGWQTCPSHLGIFSQSDSEWQSLFLRDSAFVCSRFPVGVTHLSCMKSELAGSHRLMSRPDTYLGIRTHLSICAGMEHFIFRLMYVQLYLDLWRQVSKDVQIC